MAKLSIHLPDPLLKKVTAYAKARDQSRNSVLAGFIAEGLQRAAAETQPAEPEQNDGQAE